MPTGLSEAAKNYAGPMLWLAPHLALDSRLPSGAGQNQAQGAGLADITTRGAARPVPRQE